MKKIIAILSITTFFACSNSTNPIDTTADSAAISKKIDNTTDKMNGMSDSTKAKMDNLVNKADSTVKMMADSSKLK